MLEVEVESVATEAAPAPIAKTPIISAPALTPVIAPIITAPIPIADPLVGTTIAGRYRLERLVAKGGMGRVYLATQLALDRRVAVKVMAQKPDAVSDPQFIKRFFLEASVSSKLSHPNIVTVHDYGEDAGGQLFMAMEYLDGEPLSTVIKRDGPLPVDRALSIALPIARGLRESHAHGIIHRDLKPGNVMLLFGKDEDAGDAVKVLDFGLVKIFRTEGEAYPADLAELDLTRAGILLGSPRYMSPEQVRNETLDPRTDLYSLGVILYHMLAGHSPFNGKTSIDIMHAHLHDPPAPLLRVPEGVAALVMRLLEKRREDRFPDAQALIVELKALLAAQAAAPITSSEHSLTNTAPAAAFVEPSAASASASSTIPTPAIAELSVPKMNRAPIYVAVAIAAVAAAFAIQQATSRKPEPPEPLQPPPPPQLAVPAPQPVKTSTPVVDPIPAAAAEAAPNEPQPKAKTKRLEKTAPPREEPPADIRLSR